MSEPINNIAVVAPTPSLAVPSIVNAFLPEQLANEHPYSSRAGEGRTGSFLAVPMGGKVGAILLSFVQTCRGLQINPREYLEDIFRRLMRHSAKRLEELLPDQWHAAKQNSA